MNLQHSHSLTVDTSTNDSILSFFYKQLQLQDSSLLNLNPGHKQRETLHANSCISRDQETLLLI
jgi:hypothetical protein